MCSGERLPPLNRGIIVSITVMRVIVWHYSCGTMLLCFVITTETKIVSYFCIQASSNKKTFRMLKCIDTPRYDVAVGMSCIIE